MSRWRMSAFSGVALKHCSWSTGGRPETVVKLNCGFFIIVTHDSESSQEQQRLREKQKMLKNDWERFKQQRKEIESSLMEKP